MTFAEREVDAGGVRLRYREAGAGYPVVAIDGLPWPAPAFSESLAREYRVLELDWPAAAPPAATPPTAREMAVLASRAVAALVDGGYTLIGTSSGAAAALWLALLQPESVEALVLISPVGIGPAAGGPDQGEDGKLTARSLFAHPEAAPVLAAGSEPTALEQAALARLQSASDDSGRDRGIGRGLEERLADVRCPTLVAFGQEDRVTSPLAARVFQERVPNCNVAWVYDAGHAIAVERPEALANLVLDYVKRRETFIVEDRNGLINP